MIRRFFLGLILVIASLSGRAQSFDLTITTLVAPASGCSLSNSAVITILVYNAGPAGTGWYAQTSFDVSYSLDGGPVVTETVPLASGLNGGLVYSYSFIAQADFSACQVHTLDFEVIAVVPETNTANNTWSTTVTSDCPPTPGTITAPATVCSGINTGNFVISGYNGNPEDWYYSTDGGTTYLTTGNMSDTQPYTNINVQMYWWALMGSPYGYCADDSTPVVMVDVVPQTVAGTLPSSYDICDNGNAGQIDLTGYLGNVLQWEYSYDGGVDWDTLSNVSDSLEYWNLNDTITYQVLVQNSICPAAYSNQITLTLIPGTDAGSIVGELLVCNFENDSSLEVNPIVGAPIDWIVSYNNGSTWSSTGVTDTIYPYSGLLGYTVFGAIIQEASCPTDTVYHSIVVLPLAPNTGLDVSIFEDDSVQLSASGGINFLWFPVYNISDETIYNPIVWPEVTTVYNVQVTDINGCIDTASVTVTVLPNLTEIQVPNLLTPNADNFNDLLVIPNIDTYPNNEIIIFNGYGQVIYQAQPYYNDWDATFNGAVVPDGTYYYVLDLHDPALVPDPFKGIITVIGNE